MTEQAALSPDTDKRFVESVIARKLVDADTVSRISSEHEQELALGKTVGSLAEFLCAKGLLDRRTAAEILRDVRAERARDSTWPNDKGPNDDGPGERDAETTVDQGVAPARVGDYVLERELGRGGMGSVWLGRNEKTGATRAVKLLDGIGDAERLARFRLEAEALARVGGDVVVPVHEIGVARGRIYFVMGVMSGGSLRTRLNEKGPYPWREAVRIAAQVARALERCHAVGLIHRDLKPDNVLLDTQGRPRLADFGVARDLTGASLTETGTVLGTPVYMPPEQLQGLKVDARADVYALGALLHELISGERPFSGKSVFEVFEAKQSSSSEPLPATTPAALAAIIARALAPAAKDRQATAGELASDLERLLEGSWTGKTLAIVPSRRKLLVAVIVAGLAVLAGEAVVLVLRAPPPVPAPPLPQPVRTAGDDLAAANRDLLAAAGVIAAPAGSLEEARRLVERARKACPDGSIPAEGLAKVHAALHARTDLILARAEPVPSERTAAAYRELKWLRAIAERVPLRIPVTIEQAELAASAAVWLRGRPDRDWDEILEAALVALEKVPQVADEMASAAVECALGQKPVPERAVAVIERACAVSPEPKRRRCFIKRIEVHALAGSGEKMLEAAIALFADSAPARPSREEVSQVVHAIMLQRLATPLPPARVEALVAAAGGETPELVLLRAELVPERLADAAEALLAGFIHDTDTERAVRIIGPDRRLVRGTGAALIRKGRRTEAAFLLEQSLDQATRDAGATLRRARTPDELAAVAEALER